MFATVDEVGAVAEAEGIDAHFHKGGTLELATAPTARRAAAGPGGGGAPLGLRRRRRPLARSRRGRGPARTSPRCHGAVYTPHCARVHPARLARGLADAVERRGVTIYEQTRVVGSRPGAVGTAGGRVKADVVVRATEGYTAQLPAAPAHARARCTR